MKRLNLRYLPLTWFAVILTGFIIYGLFRIFGINFASLASSMNLNSPWILALPIALLFLLII
jgi:hypothetical protein